MFSTYNRENEIEKALNNFFGDTAKDNYELREVLKMKMLGKVDEAKLKELQECREKDLEYINERYQYREAIIIGEEPPSTQPLQIPAKPDGYKSSNGF